MLLKVARDMREAERLSARDEELRRPQLHERACARRRLGAGFAKRFAGVSGGSVWSPLDEDPIIGLISDVGVSTDAAGVYEWKDQSGNGNHVTQSTDAKKPGKTASDPNGGGHPSINFDGSDDILVAASAINTDTTNGLTFLMVWRPTSDGSRILWCRDSGSSFAGWMFDYNGTSNERVFLDDGGSDTNDGTGSGASKNTTYAHRGYITGSALELFRDGAGNGAASHAFSLSNCQSTEAFALGGESGRDTQFMGMDVWAVFVYDKQLSADVVSKWQNWVENTKAYGVTF